MSGTITCIQFNPVDDRYFISGSLDTKVRIWSIPYRQVVDWTELHEMVTAACYKSDGQGALVGSYKGSCHLYNTSENKLQQKSHGRIKSDFVKNICKDWSPKGRIKRVIFGVPTPGKKRKFMEVSKHCVADGTSKFNDGNDSVKLAKFLIPQGS